MFLQYAVLVIVVIVKIDELCACVKLTVAEFTCMLRQNQRWRLEMECASKCSVCRKIQSTTGRACTWFSACSSARNTAANQLPTYTSPSLILIIITA